MVNDSHCHFFSPAFFQTLAQQRAALQRTSDVHVQDLYRELQWDDPGSPEALADRWVREMDANGVHRAALIASVPGDESSVGAAVARHPTRLVGFFMVNPAAGDARQRTRLGLTALGLTGVCLFPAMHQVPLDDPRTRRVVEEAAACPGAVVFVHCGLLSIGVRGRLGLPSAFDLALGDPLAVSRLARDFPETLFIVPHFGAGRFADLLAAIDASANVCVDTSSSNNWIRAVPGLELSDVFRKAISAGGASRLLFGTDSSFFPRGWQRGIYEQQTSILQELDITPEEQSLILHGNFERLFPAPRSG